MKSLLLTLSLILLVGCAPEPAPVAATAQVDQEQAGARLSEAAQQHAETAPPVESVKDAIGASVAAVVEAVEIVVAPVADPVPAPPPIDRDCTRLLIDLEVGGEDAYRRRYWMPILPPGDSGITIGLGYDLRYTTETLLRTDWVKHAQLDRLVAAVGLHGDPARMLVAQMTDVETPFELAVEVFEQVSAPVYYQITRRMFGGQQFDTLDRDYQCGLFLVGYNRGGSMQGLRRAELRVIRDKCIPAQDKACAAMQNRLSKRHWRGSDIERGMNLRREAESVRIERKAA